MEREGPPNTIYEVTYPQTCRGGCETEQGQPWRGHSKPCGPSQSAPRSGSRCSPGPEKYRCFMKKMMMLLPLYCLGKSGRLLRGQADCDRNMLVSSSSYSSCHVHVVILIHFPRGKSCRLLVSQQQHNGTIYCQDNDFPLLFASLVAATLLLLLLLLLLPLRSGLSKNAVLPQNSD